MSINSRITRIDSRHIANRGLYNDYFFSTTTGFVFLIGILVYLYYMILEYKNYDYNKPEETIKVVDNKQMWKYTFLIMLISGFYVGAYKLYK